MTRQPWVTRFLLSKDNQSRFAREEHQARLRRSGPDLGQYLPKDSSDEEKLRTIHRVSLGVSHVSQWRLVGAEHFANTRVSRSWRFLGGTTPCADFVGPGHCANAILVITEPKRPQIAIEQEAKRAVTDEIRWRES